MEEVEPYSIDVVFLAQLAIITIYSPCSAVKCTIRNATIRAAQTETHTHTRTRRHTHPHRGTYSAHKNVHACEQQPKMEGTAAITAKERSTVYFYVQ